MPSTQCDVYKADPHNARVRKFDTSRHFLAPFGKRGTEMGPFVNGPAGVAVDQTGNIYTAETDGTIQMGAPSEPSAPRHAKQTITSKETTMNMKMKGRPL